MQNIKNKLFNWEAPLPANAWGHITEALDKDEEYLISQKLNNHTVAPPFNAWEKIEASLNAAESDKAPVVAIRKPFKKVWQLTSVAAIVLAVVLATFLLTTKSTTEQPTFSASEAPVATAPDYEQAVPQNNSINTTIADVEDKELFVQQSAGSFQKKSRLRNTNNIPEIGTLANEPINTLEDYIPQSEPVVSVSYVDRYVLFAKNSGDVVKVSKKLYNTFSCSDLINDELCKQQIEALQQKAAQSSATTSSDFTGVLEIISHIQEQ